jgi:arginase
MNLMELQIITSNWEYGAGKKGTSEGPQALLESLRSKGAEKLLQLPRIDVEQTVEYEDVETIQYPKLKRAKPLIEHQERFASAIESSRGNLPFQLLLTGDHSNAIGGLAGFCRKGDQQ